MGDCRGLAPSPVLNRESRPECNLVNAVPMPIINIRGVPHRYDVVGAGSVLVFLHGWLLSRHYWQPLIDLLKADFTCLSYDLRGFGASQPTVKTAEFTLDSYVEDLAELLTHLGVANCWLVGHSLGGRRRLVHPQPHPLRHQFRVLQHGKMTAIGQFPDNLLPSAKPGMETRQMPHIQTGHNLIPLPTHQVQGLGQITDNLRQTMHFCLCG